MSAKDAFRNANWFQCLTFRWVNPLVEKGAVQQVGLADTAELIENDDVVVNTNRLNRCLETTERTNGSHPLLKAVVWAYWPELFVLQTLQVVNHWLGLLSPLLLQQVLVFQERENDQTQELEPGQIRSGLRAVQALLALHLFQIFFSQHLEFYQARVGLRIGSALRGVVLQRCVAASPRGEDAPAVYNVVSFDVGPNIDIIWIILGLWLFPIQFGSTLAVLASQVGDAVIPGVVVIVVAKIICGILLCFDGVFRHYLLLAKDDRLSRCNESFGSIRTLQMLSWVAPFRQRIMDSRETELRMANRRLWMAKMVEALDYSLSTMVTFAVLGYYVAHSNGALDASLALPVIALASSLTGPLGNFPVWAQQYLIWKSAYARVNLFMGYGKKGGRPFGGGAAPPPLPPAPPGDGGDGVGARRQQAIVDCKGCSLSWGDEDAQEEDGDVEQPLVDQSATSFKLRDLNFTLDGGDLMVVVGRQGQGKSSLLHAILGEMAISSGSLHSPAPRLSGAAVGDATGSTGVLTATGHHALPENVDGAREEMAMEPKVTQAVPFSAQSAVLFSGTLQMNIIFGMRHDPAIYREVLRACELNDDLARMPDGDMTVVMQGGTSLSGGQRARVCLARAVYRAALTIAEEGRDAPVVLLDDPFCALDRTVTRSILRALFSPSGGARRGLLSAAAVVVTSADPWWVADVSPGPEQHVKVGVLREGTLVAMGPVAEMMAKDFPELTSLKPTRGTQGRPQHCTQAEDTTAGQPDPDIAEDTDVITPFDEGKAGKEFMSGKKQGPAKVEDEHREQGCVKGRTYFAYFEAVGYLTLLLTALVLVSIMVSQNATALWITYWTSDDKSTSFMWPILQWFGYTSPPEDPPQLLTIYGYFVFWFTASNFCGHAAEIVGGIGAAGRIFNDALQGTLGRPFRWWDTNPTGRILNRFSEDVDVMDSSLTNILGVIFGATIYFIGHMFILGLSNPMSVSLLPIIALGLEFYAQYYRTTIRELQRNFLVCMSSLYQDMVESIVGNVTIRAYDVTRSMMCRTMVGLSNYQQIAFAKESVQKWLLVRMSLIGFSLGAFNTMRPILQYFGYLKPQSAALVGFSIQFSQQTVDIIKQFIMNYSSLEMQLVSIERLQEYADAPKPLPPAATAGSQPPRSAGLQLANVEVTYAPGLPPALRGVSLTFEPREVAAIAGRTGAGKSSLLLSVLQLVPYTGNVWVNGQLLKELFPVDVRRKMVGVVPQQPVIFAGSLRWNLDPENLYQDQMVWEALQAVGLEHACREAGHGKGLDVELVGSYGTTAKPGMLALSQGQQQLLCAARALLRQPQVALLDEVTATLPSDAAVATTEMMLGKFKAINATVLLVTHQEDLFPLCNRVVTLSNGSVVADTGVYD